MGRLAHRRQVSALFRRARDDRDLFRAQFVVLPESFGPIKACSGVRSSPALRMQPKASASKRVITELLGWRAEQQRSSRLARGLRAARGEFSTTPGSWMAVAVRELTVQGPDVNAPMRQLFAESAPLVGNGPVAKAAALAPGVRALGPSRKSVE